MIVLTYLMIQLGKISSKSLEFSILNGVGALLVLFSLYFEFNLSAFIVEFFWAVISLLGIILTIRRRRGSTSAAMFLEQMDQNADGKESK